MQRNLHCEYLRIIVTLLLKQLRERERKSWTMHIATLHLLKWSHRNCKLELKR